MRGFPASVFGNTYLKEGLLLAVAVTLLVVTQSLLMPRVTNVHYRYADQAYTADSLPLAVNLQPRHRTMEAWATLELFPFQRTEFRVAGDDCLAILDVNGTRVVDKPSCTFSPQPQNFELGGYLHAGKNDIHIVVNDTRGVKIGFSFEPTGSDPFIMMLRILIMLLPLFWLATIVHRTIGRTMPELSVIIYAGLLLRIMYVTVTPPEVRNYDMGGHIEYIEYMLKHWTVPFASSGWEFHQGPLYYALNASILGAAKIFGQSKSLGLQWMQYFSLLLSSLSVIAGAWCGLVLFDRVHQRKALLLFTALIAVFPSTLMFASRINNDVLFLVLAFCFAASLFTWWRNGEFRWLVLTSIIIGAGFLTKANSYLFAPILLICIVFRPGVSSGQKVLELATVGTIIVVLAGWLLILRYQQNDFQRLFLHGDGMNPMLKAPTSWKEFVTFIPESIIRTPFVFSTPVAERSFFWAYFFRTALFSESTFQGTLVIFMARLMACLGMGSVLIAIQGIVRSVRRQDKMVIPLLVMLIIVLEGAFAYRFLHPSLPNQDFRFSVLLVPVIAYFAVRGAETEGHAGRLMQAWLRAFVVIAALFFLGVTLKH